MDQFPIKAFIDLPAQPGHMNVDDVVERCDSGWFLPYLSGQHFPRNDLFLVLEEIFEQFKLP
jgi:hypothetical protein